MTKSDPRIGVYLRVSSQEQSVDMQRHELQAYVQARGWVNVTYYEEKVSGSTTNRLMLQRLLEDANRRRIDIVLTWKLDRLARSLRDLVNLIDSFGNVAVSLISLKENIDLSSSTGRLLVHMIGAFAQFERDLIIQRVRSGLDAAKKKGIKLGRPRVIEASRVLELRKQNWSLGQIARELKVSKSGVHKTLVESGFKNRSLTSKIRTEN